MRDYNWDAEEIAEELGFSAIHTAVTLQKPIANDFEILLRQNFRLVNACDRLKMTPLHWAARNGRFMAVDLLIKWNANVDARDEHLWTPLHEACESGDLECITRLLDAGADVNAEMQDGKTPLFCYLGGVQGVLPLLLEKGANINHRNSDGKNVLHFAAHTGIKQVIDEHITHGADLNATDNWGQTPIQKGIMHNQTLAVSALLQSSKMHGVSLFRSCCEFPVCSCVLGSALRPFKGGLSDCMGVDVPLHFVRYYRPRANHHDRI